jgi:hypothetical protein
VELQDSSFIKKTWKEEVIDFQNPYAFEIKSFDELSFYPNKLLFIIFSIIFFLYIKI